VRVADYQVHARQGGDFFWCALRVTTSDYDFRFRIFSSYAPNCRAGVLIGARGYRTCVENHERGFGGRGRTVKSAIFELAFERRAIGLGSAAAKVLYIKSGHTLWYRIEWPGLPGPPAVKPRKSSRGLPLPPRHKTFPAEDGTALGRAEWHGSLFSASRTDNLSKSLFGEPNALG